MLWQRPPSVAAFQALFERLASDVDIVCLDREGKIVLIEIFARPPAAMLKLRERMGTHIRSDPVAARLMALPA